jgi:hypothetical protein
MNLFPKPFSYLFFLVLFLPAICFAQLNSDSKLIKRKKIKEVFAYRIEQDRYDSTRSDTVFRYYSYDINGNLVGVQNLQSYVVRNYLQYDGYGNWIYGLSFANDAHNNIDTGGYYVAKYDSLNKLTYQFSLGYSYGGYRSAVEFQAYKTDGDIAYPPLYSDTTVALFKNADFIMQRRRVDAPRDGYLLIERHDTIFYYENTWHSITQIQYFIVTEKTENGYIARIYSVKNGAVFYRGVTKCVGVQEYGDWWYVTDTSYNYTFPVTADLRYDSAYPRLEDKIKGEFIRGSGFPHETWPSEINVFLAENFNKNGKLEPFIEQRHEPLPPYSKEYREAHSFETLKKQYQFVLVTEYYE